MRLSQNLRISHKISALMVGLIIGFIVIGVTYYLQIKIENDARLASQETLAFRTQLANINAAATETFSQNRQAYQLSASDTEAGLTQRQQQLADQLQALQELATSDTQIGLATEVIAQFDQYHQSLQQALELQQQLGSTETKGYLYKEKNAQRTLAVTLANTNQVSLQPFASLLRQNDVLEQNIVTSINTELLAVGLDGDLQQNLLQQLSAYSTAQQASTETRNTLQSFITDISNTEFQIANQLSSALAAEFTAGLGTEQANTEQRQIIQAVVTAIIFAVAMGTAVGVYFLYKSIVFPMVHMQSVIRKINKGKTNSRVKVLSGDELGDLGTAFNQLLDERIKQLEDRSLENDQLNNSIISLIRAVGMIAQKDLTIKVPVSPDITGTVSDAVNLLTTETAKTLHEVKTISEHVNDISQHLQEQSGLVMQFADGEKRQILATAKALDILARAMNEVASHAETADTSAAKAIDNTQQARQSVEETVSGIRTIRETISETEKRTKRLGDRSQEISGIVSLINTIAERTHILALNASMHAASAGEAGRGFAVVADEVQRLAESARQSTDEIASMVNNMRVETSDTVAIMNTLISQVADGSRLAEEAGKRMANTEEATQALVEEVQYISKQAIQQAELANKVRDRSGLIRKFTDKTGKQLEEQKQQTDSLKQYADTLVQQVNVFTLPEFESKILGTPVLPNQNIEQPHETTAVAESGQDVSLPEPHTLPKPDGNISPLQAAG